MLLKKAWIWSADIVELFVNTASLMMLPGLNPLNVAGRIPACAEAGATADADDEAAVNGTRRPTSSAIAANALVTKR